MYDIHFPDNYLVEYRYAEISDTDGRTLHGTAVRYGDVSTKNSYGGPEQFEAGAFGDVSSLNTLMNIMHDRKRPVARNGNGLVLTDSPSELRIAATMPNTRDGDDVLENVRNGVYQGFSVEFLSRQEAQKNGVRSISRAALPGIAIVDNPAYSDSLIAEIRQDGEGITGEIAYDTDMIISATEKVRKERIKPGAFDYAIREPTREINLVLGNNERPLASKQAGSLELEDTPTALKFRVKRLPRTSYVADFLGMLRTKSVTPGVIPLFSPTPLSVARRLFSDGRGATFEEPEEGNTGVFRRVVRSGLLTALSILFRPPRGNPGAVTTLPRRLRRPSTATQTVAGAIRPISGDIVRDGRVIRNGEDIGPVVPSLARRRVI